MYKGEKPKESIVGGTWGSMLLLGREVWQRGQGNVGACISAAFWDTAISIPELDLEKIITLQILNYKILQLCK